MHINDLPNEILSSTFLLSSLLRDRNDYRYRNRTTMPFVVAQVCRRWRGVAIGFQELWSFICIDMLGEKHRDEVKDDVPCLKKPGLMLERSGNHPLDIVILGLLQVLASQVRDLILPHTRRWRTFKNVQNGDFIIEVPHFFLDPNNSYNSELITPLLEVLEIRSKEYPEDEDSDHVISGYYYSLRCPNLRRLDLQLAPFHWDKLLEWLSVGSVTHLTVSFWEMPISSEYLDGVLNAMPHLEYLDLGVMEFRWGTDAGLNEISVDQILPLIDLPKLTTLKLGGMWQDCMDAWMWLARLECPTLSDLTMSHHWDWGPVWRRGYISQLPRVTKQLQSLKTLRLNPHFYGCMEFFEYGLTWAPSVTRLIIRFYEDDTLKMASIFREMRGLQSPDLKEVQLETWYNGNTSVIARMKDTGHTIVQKNPDLKVMVMLRAEGKVVEFDDNLPDGGLSSLT
ncbi:hypothetical protein FRC02_003815 [Tulasnella sp. 418]|nr:hypothetical protein FRC02_003815 [Tulasnella sp. 418]